jgi:hypothetical protein
MCKSFVRGFFCLTLLFGSFIPAGASTLLGYAVSHKGPNINAKMPGALVEFRDALTDKPANVKIKIGTAIKGRKDAFYAATGMDGGKWQADVKPGRYIVTITGGSGEKIDSYSLNLNALPPACSTSTGYLDVTSCGATGSSSGDDTQAIIDGVAAIDAVGGGVLFFPKGYYNVGTNTATNALLPIALPSGITIEGVNGGVLPASLGNTRITLLLGPTSGLVTGKPIFKIGEGKRHITMRDITLLAYDQADPSRIIPGSMGVVAEGDTSNPNSSTLGVLFSNMSIYGVDVGIDVKQCTKKHEYGLNCAVDPEADPPVLMIPWQFDIIKADHVNFSGNIGVRMNTEDTDWEFSNCSFNVPSDEETHGIPQSSGLHIMRGGFIQVNNSFGAASGPQPGGNFIYVGSIGTLMVINSQAENVRNSIVFGRDYIDGDPENADLGSFAERIVVTGSEFGAPIRLRHRVTYVSTGNHYGPETIQTSTELVHIWSMGDKFCGDGYVDTCTPAIQGPGTIVFMSGSPAESTGIDEIPAKFGVDSIFSKSVQIGSVTYSVLSSTYSTAAPGSMLYCSDCAANTSTGDCQAGGSGAFAKRGSGNWKCN